MSKTSKNARKTKAKVPPTPSKALRRSASHVDSRRSELATPQAKRRSAPLAESKAATAPNAADNVAELMLAWSPLHIFLRQQATFASMFSREGLREPTDKKQTSPRGRSAKSRRRA